MEYETVGGTALANFSRAPLPRGMNAIEVRRRAVRRESSLLLVKWAYPCGLRSYSKGQSKIYYMTWPLEKGNSCKEVCLPRMKILQRKPIALSPFPWKMFLPLIHQQQILHGSINEAIKNPSLSLRVTVDEKLDIEDEDIWLINRSCKQLKRKLT